MFFCGRTGPHTCMDRRCCADAALPAHPEKDEIMDPITIMGSVKTAIDLAKTVKDVASDTNLKIETRDLYDSMISLQNIIFSLQSENQSLLNSKYELEKKLMEFEGWEKEKAKYKLIEIGKGVVTYAFDTSQDPSIPSHYICKNCYNDRTASILDPVYMHSEGSRYSCPRCKTEFSTHVDAPDQTHADSDYDL